MLRTPYLLTNGRRTWFLVAVGLMFHSSIATASERLERAKVLLQRSPALRQFSLLREPSTSREHTGPTARPLVGFVAANQGGQEIEVLLRGDERGTPLWRVERVPGPGERPHAHTQVYPDGKIVIWVPGFGRPAVWEGRWLDNQQKLMTTFGGSGSELSRVLQALPRELAPRPEAVVVDAGPLIHYVQALIPLPSERPGDLRGRYR